MTIKHTQESILKTFQDVDEGILKNADFSHANVVMVSKDSYYSLMGAWETLYRLKVAIQTGYPEYDQNDWIDMIDTALGLTS